MKLTKREIAWEKRKKKSGPSYDEYGKARGQFEERLKKVIDFFHKFENHILFIVNQVKEVKWHVKLCINMDSINYLILMAG